MTGALLLSLLILSVLTTSRGQSAPESSPAPTPQSGADVPSSPPFFPVPDGRSPPSPLPDLASASSPSPDVDVVRFPPAPPPREASPSPSPDGAVRNKDQSMATNSEESDQQVSSGGGRGNMAGRVAGILIGVVVGAAILALLVVVYRKRQENIRRSHYGFAARREML